MTDMPQRIWRWYSKAKGGYVHSVAPCPGEQQYHNTSQLIQHIEGMIEPVAGSEYNTALIQIIEHLRSE